MSNGAPRLTVLRALGLGDTLTAVPALRALARAFPEHRRLLVGPSWLEPLLPLVREGGRPCIHELVPADGLGADAASLPQESDIAVNLHGSGPESHALLFATEPRRVIAFRCEDFRETASMPVWDANEHEAHRCCRLLRHCGIDAAPDELAIDCPDIDLPRWARGATILHPGAASAARRWPPERWAEVARAEGEAGREVLVTGSRKEIGLARWIATMAGLDPRHQMAGRTNLYSLATLVGAAGTVVCGDTGVAHLATALGIPSVLLFGPTSPHAWGPPAGRAIHRVLWDGRTGDPHAEVVYSGLLAIEVEDVLAAIGSLRLATAV